MAIRKHGSEKHSIKVSKVPKLNFKAEQHVDLIDRQQAIRVEPPLTKSTREHNLVHCIVKSDLAHLSFSKFPGHSQAVAEREYKQSVKFHE